MDVLLTGATGYIGRRLLPILLEAGHRVYCCVRDTRRFDTSAYPPGQVLGIEADFLDPKPIHLPPSVEAAYYLIHSMSASTEHFADMEHQAAKNFVEATRHTALRQVIYLGGIANHAQLSRHLASRRAVEEVLRTGSYALTTLRAGIIVGSGSASFEIIRDLVEKLPLMVAPRWLNTPTQPIAIRNVLQFLHGVLLQPSTYHQSYDIGGPEVLTYKQMLLQFAQVRRLRRWVGVVPVMTPRLSSYWLYFITSTSYKLAVNLVDSMKVEVRCLPNDLAQRLGISLLTYRQAVELAFGKIVQNETLSSWTDAASTDILRPGIAQLMQVPQYGCYTDYRQAPCHDTTRSLERIWAIGGHTGWYYANWLWAIRGFLDKVFGGVGLRRGRRHPSDLAPGDALDFWRVLLADPTQQRLLLYAEMRLPGEAWLEFRIQQGVLHQQATFRPRGLWGRAYWYAVLPFHGFLFRGMLHQLTKA